MPDSDAIEEAVRSRYAAAAAAAAGCCDVAEGFGADGSEVYGAARYDTADLDGLPAQAVAASIGCANPVALADLHAGETVLDLGSGGGIDVLLSAQRIGPRGKAYGVDMTAEMLDLARANRRRAGVDNAEFLDGRIDAVPLPDEVIDVIVSNCVINLSPDKPAVFAEVFRVLRAGGRLGVADVVVEDHMTDQQRTDRAVAVGCVVGALSFGEYSAELGRAGFADIEVTSIHDVGDGVHSAIVRATKPPAT